MGKQVKTQEEDITARPDKKAAETQKKHTDLTGMARRLRRILLGLGVLLLLGGALYIGAGFSGLIPQKDGKVATISASTLERIFEISELSTVDYTYNAIAKAYGEDGETVKYYVAYEGTVTAGIDFNKIVIEQIDEEEKKIVITLPDVEILDRIINAGTMEYIFTKDKYETETVSQEAYKLCLDDLEKRIGEENSLYDLARENGIAAVEGLITPWVKELDCEYTVIVK